jgi:hypothetical protein
MYEQVDHIDGHGGYDVSHTWVWRYDDGHERGQLRIFRADPERDYEAFWTMDELGYSGWTCCHETPELAEQWWKYTTDLLDRSAFPD